MIIVDAALRRRESDGCPIRVGMIGAGFMGHGVANQILNSVPGMRLVAIANRSVEKAKHAYEKADAVEAAEAGTRSELDKHIHAGTPVVTADFESLCMSEQIDAVLKLTGDVSFGASAALCAIAAGKHFVTMNAELDGTLGPLLARRAQQAGVVYSVSDGDQSHTVDEHCMTR